MSSLGIVDPCNPWVGLCSFLPSPGPVQQSWLEQGAQALSSMQLTFLSGKQAEEGASKLPGQKQSWWEQAALSVSHKADALVGASSFPVKWYLECGRRPLTALSSLRVPCNLCPFWHPFQKLQVCVQGQFHLPGTPCLLSVLLAFGMRWNCLTWGDFVLLVLPLLPIFAGKPNSRWSWWAEGQLCSEKTEVMFGLGGQCCSPDSCFSLQGVPS